MTPDIGLESIEHDPEAGRYRVTYDRETPPSVAVPAAIEEITDKETWELNPLHAVVDPEALDELFQPSKEVGPRKPPRVTFTYESYDVTVCSDQRLVVRASTDPELNSIGTR